MSRVLYLLILMLYLPLMAATCVDQATGTYQDPVTKEWKQSPGGGPAGEVGGLLGLIFPWTTVITGAVTASWLEIRRRNWKAAATSTIAGVEDLFATPEGAALKEKATVLLAKRHNAASGFLVPTKELVDSVLHPKA